MKISKDSVTAILAEHDGGFTMSRLASALDVGKGQRNRLRALVEELVEEGAVAKDGRKFILAEKPKPKRKRRNAGEETATRGSNV